MARKDMYWKRIVVEYLQDRDGGMCLLCNHAIEGHFDVDHIIEIRNGGKDEINNLRLVHVGCHRERHGLAGKVILKEYSDLKRELDIEFIRKLKEAYNKYGNLTRAAQVTGINRFKAYRILKSRGLDPGNPSSW